MLLLYICTHMPTCKSSLAQSTSGLGNHDTAKAIRTTNNTCLLPSQLKGTRAPSSWVGTGKAQMSLGLYLFQKRRKHKSVRETCPECARTRPPLLVEMLKGGLDDYAA